MSRQALPGFLPRLILSRTSIRSRRHLTGIWMQLDEDDVADLETIRGGIFKCSLLLPQGYTGLHFLSKDKIMPTCGMTRERGAKRSSCSIQRFQ